MDGPTSPMKDCGFGGGEPGVPRRPARGAGGGGPLRAWNWGFLVVLIWILGWGGAGPGLASAAAAEGSGSFRIQLKWYHQFQFAGYYAAEAKGFYAAEGLKVTILEGGQGKAPIEVVLRGDADFGVSDAEVVLRRLQGQPLVACAAVFQHSPYIILSRRDRGISTPSDLVGKEVMMEDGQGAVQFLAMLGREGIAQDRVRFRRHSWDLSDLIEGRVDAMSAYAMVEPQMLLQRGVEPAVLRTPDYGIDFYGDTLFTTEALVRARRPEVTAFLRASLRGWEYAMAHPQEIADLILNLGGVQERSLSRDLILRQAQGMKPYILSDVVPVGHMNLGRWEHIAEVFAAQGLAKRPADLEGFLFEANPAPDPAIARKLAYLGGGSLLIAALALLWNVQIRRLVRQRTRELQTEIARRQQTEEGLTRALAESQRLRVALDGVSSCVYMKDLESRYFYANRITREAFGCSGNEYQGRGDPDFFPADAVRRIREIDGRVFRGEQTVEEVEVVDERWGRRVFLEVKTPLYSDANERQICGLVGISTDITERCRTAERLRQSEAEFRLLFQQNPTPLGMYSLERGVVRLNQQFTQVLGYVAEDFPSLLDWWRLAFPEPGYRERVRDEWNRLVKAAARGDGNIGPMEVRVTAKDGSVRTMQVSGSHLGDSILGAFFDLTDRIETQAKLELQSAALNAAANAIVITDSQGAIVFGNPAFSRLTGYSVGEVLGRNPRFLKSGMQNDAFYARLWRTIRGGNSWQGELRNRRKDGTVYEEEMTITPVRSAEGRITHFISIKQDVTQRKALERQFLRSQRMESVGLLAGGIAHDLNNVLAPVLLSMALIRSSGLPPHLAELVDDVEQSLRRGAEIVRQVLTFARGAEGDRGPVSLRHLVREIVKMAAETFPRNIEIRSRDPGEVWTLQGDATQLHQLLLNLAVNARDAMPGGGVLTFGLANFQLTEPQLPEFPGLQAGAYVRLEVSDTGVGIPPENLDRIFEPFFTTKEPGKGTGLGLASVSGIVRGHGGAITVQSEPEQGTRFVVLLPALLNSAPPTPEVRRGLPRGRGEVVLVVDDETSILRMAENILKRFGYRPVVATSGPEALAEFDRRREEIACVISDIMMPGMSGETLLGELKRLKPELKCFASSGLVTADDPVRRIDPNALAVNRFLPKPYTAEDLLRMLEEELNPVVRG